MSQISRSHGNNKVDVVMLQAQRLCRWCRRELAASKRIDALFCGQSCRQRSFRFAVVGASAHDSTRRRTFGYADPPYPGKAHYYPERKEVDHVLLVEEMVNRFPDGWAISTSAEALRKVWQLCPAARLGVWVKAPRRVRSHRATATFEAVLWCGGRPYSGDVPPPVADALVYQGRHRSMPGALVGMKPPAFCEWVFGLLGAQPGDTLIDLFPGSGAVKRAWDRYTGYGGPDAPAMRRVRPTPLDP